MAEFQAVDYIQDPESYIILDLFDNAPSFGESDLPGHVIVRGAEVYQHIPSEQLSVRLIRLLY